jgi:hypothetical protein
MTLTRYWLSRTSRVRASRRRAFSDVEDFLRLFTVRAGKFHSIRAFLQLASGICA